MANSYVKVKFKNQGLIVYANYQNTSDYMGNKLYSNRDECLNGEYSDFEIKCEHIEEDIIIANHYGYGQTHTGKACRKCMCITFDFESWAEKEEYGWGFPTLTEDEENEQKKIKSENWLKKGLPDWY